MVNDKNGVCGTIKLTQSAREGMKGAELPVSDAFINGYGEQKGTFQKSKTSQIILILFLNYLRQGRWQRAFVC